METILGFVESDTETILMNLVFKSYLREILVLKAVLNVIEKLKKSNEKDPLKTLENIITESIIIGENRLMKYAPSEDDILGSLLLSYSETPKIPSLTKQQTI